MDKKIKVEDVVEHWEIFLSWYKAWRKQNGLEDKKIENIYEVLTGMTDKHGRICRQVKHKERKDAKNDWPEGMTSSMFGYFAYMVMVLDNYDESLADGMRAEMEETVKQHVKKRKDDV